MSDKKQRVRMANLEIKMHPSHYATAASYVNDDDDLASSIIITTRLSVTRWRDNLAICNNENLHKSTHFAQVGRKFC